MKKFDANGQNEQGKLVIQHSLNQQQLFFRYKISLTFVEDFRHGYDSSNDKTGSNKKERSSSMEVVKFTDDTYGSLSDDTIITSSSDTKEMVYIKRKSTNCSTRKAFLEKAVVELAYNFNKKSSHECLKR